jgi:thiamine-phosphate pyrophosphorylase
MQAVENLAVTQRTLDILAGMGAVERPWADRTRRVLARAEQRLSTDARKERVARVRGLYVILDPTAAKGRDLVKLAEAVLKGDARMLQLRDKQLEKGLQLPIAKRLTELCEEHKALLIVNDHADLAAASGAHGVHVGQKDLPVPETRKQLAADQLVGNSNATVEEAMLAQQQGVDYAAVGAMFPSPSKDNTRPAGIATLAKVKEQAQVPLVAIGGITEKNVAEVVAAGADAISVISAVLGAPNPGQAAKRLSEKIEKALAKRG